MVSGCQPKCTQAVSYTHLDVYKRQEVNLLEIEGTKKTWHKVKSVKGDCSEEKEDSGKTEDTPHNKWSKKPDFCFCVKQI